MPRGSRVCSGRVRRRKGSSSAWSTRSEAAAAAAAAAGPCRMPAETRCLKAATAPSDSSARPASGPLGPTAACPTPPVSPAAPPGSALDASVRLAVRWEEGARTVGARLLVTLTRLKGAASWPCSARWQRRRSSTRVPLPAPSEKTRSVDRSWARRMRRAMKRPIPAPPWFCICPRLTSLKTASVASEVTCSSSESVMPQPVSSTTTTRTGRAAPPPEAPPRRAARRISPPASVKRRALDSAEAMHWASRFASPTSTSDSSTSGARSGSGQRKPLSRARASTDSHVARRSSAGRKGA
mmetsp:Transcript_5592/g.16615  ORF Transcript_5592/g.16615 Transcript_5592/m.16615 type:complete len:297 (+) Transcript_5592:263-1153(+)